MAKWFEKLWLLIVIYDLLQEEGLIDLDISSALRHFQLSSTAFRNAYYLNIR